VPSKYFFHQRIDVRKILSVFALRQSIFTKDGIQLLLCLALHIWG
jgi:hypothetical protein